MQIRPYGFLLGLDRELLTRKEAYLAVLPSPHVQNVFHLLCDTVSPLPHEMLYLVGAR